MKIGDKVEILVPIASLQPVGGLTALRQFGTVTAVDGSYVLVRPKRRRWEADCLNVELKPISQNEFKTNENYVRK
jgi:hypothetical protein